MKDIVKSEENTLSYFGLNWRSEFSFGGQKDIHKHNLVKRKTSIDFEVNDHGSRSVSI